MRFAIFALFTTVTCLAATDQALLERGVLKSDAVLFYEFQKESLALEPNAQAGRLAFYWEHELLFQERIFFAFAEGQERLLIPVAEADKLKALLKTVNPEMVSVEVFVNEMMVDGFALQEFLTYNLALKQEVGVGSLIDTYEQTYGSKSLREALFGAPKEAAEVDAFHPPFEVKQSVEAAGSAKVSDDCGCAQQLMYCFRNCSGQIPKWGTPCTMCERNYQNCLNNCPSWDSDGDGALNGTDNCKFKPNSNQRDCDNDGKGDSCDSENGIWQTISTTPCYIDEDGQAPFYVTIELYVNDYQRDVSPCFGGYRNTTRLEDETRCVGLSEESCCEMAYGWTGLCGEIGNNYCQ